MKISEFCKLYGVTHQTVNDKIKRAKDGILKGHVTKVEGKPTQLDDFAAEYLRPKPQKVEMLMEDIYSNKKSVAELIQKLNSLSASIMKNSTEFRKNIDRVEGDVEKKYKELTRKIDDYISLSEERYTALSAALTEQDKRTTGRLEELSRKVDELDAKAAQPVAKKGLFG